MNIEKIYFITLVIMGTIILNISFSDSFLGTFRVNDCVPIIVPLNATEVNITSITNPPPNPAVTSLNSPMTKDGNIFNYTYCNTTNTGVYAYSYMDNLGNSFGNSFEITTTGQQFTLSKAVLYIFMVLVALGLFLILLGVGIMLPVTNNKDEMTGYILAVNNLKYLKIISLGIAYVVLVVLFYFSYILSYSYLEIDILANIFNFLFVASAVMIIPGFILFTYILIANAVRDHKVGEALSRGFRIKE